MSKFEGTVEGIIFRNEENGWTVASVRLDGSGSISVVGVLPYLTPGEHAIFDGDLVNHKDYGQQIRCSSYESTRPETKSAVEMYLRAGNIKGIGEATAKLIVAHFGARTLDILESEPERLTEVHGIGKVRAAQIAESFMEQAEGRATMMFLQSFGLSPSVSKKIFKAYGEMTEQIVRKNPYRLVQEIEGVGFKTADAIADRMGISKESKFRLGCGIEYVLSEAMNGDGHMYLPEAVVIDQAKRMLGASEEVVDVVLRELILSGELIADDINGDRAIYLRRCHGAEQDVARMLLAQKNSVRLERIPQDELLSEIEQYERDEGVILCEEQRQAVMAAVNEGVTVITGGPGTGKTTSINCIIRLMRRRWSVELCAPTGRAAKRMSEATGCEARTIHRLLEYSADGSGFQRNEDAPLSANVVIVDEMSMVDIFLMRSLLKALRSGTRLVLVGDADQLPSVGAGNVLRDLIAADVVRVVCLTEIFRQAQESMIVMNAHKINHGQYPVLRVRDTDFFMERRDNLEEAAQTVVGLVQKRLPKYLNVDSLRGIQVMAPMKRGELGVNRLNQRLQEALNPHQPGTDEIKRGEWCFRLGDKVMQIRNNYDLEWETDFKSGKGVFNGDIGYIRQIDAVDGQLTVEFDDGRRAVYESGLMDELEPAYCMSVHKSQGSEFEAVVLPLISGPRMLMTRNLLYTAVTRAKKLVVIVGRESCVQMMVDNNRIMRRYSALSRRLQQ